MNAKKIMGAVLVALLAAALFVGAGAAAMNLGTVFVNQGLNASEYNSLTWADSTGAGVALQYDPMDTTKVYFPKAGVYSGSVEGTEYILTVVSPEVFITGIAGEGIYAYPFIPGTLYAGTEDVTLTLWSNAVVADATNVTLFLGYPNGDNKKIENTTLDLVLSDIVGIISDEDAALGEYSITAVFNPNLFVNGTKSNQIAAKPVTFTLAEAETEATLSAAVDQIQKGSSVTLTITGQPGEKYQVMFNEAGDFTVDVNQLGLYGTSAIQDGNGFNFTMPNAGEVVVVVVSTANAENSEKIELLVWDSEESEWDKQASVTIKLEKATITATLGAPSYFIGADIKVILSSTIKLADDYTFNITGTNLKVTKIENEDQPEKDGDKLVYTIPTKDVKLDVGTYTIRVTDSNGVVATLPIAFKQPFISIADAPEVIVQNKSATFLINAEATTAIQAYIFGTNKFIAVFNGSIKNEEDEDGEDILNLFNVTLKEDVTKNMSTGQYFAVFQHPMYDGFFNINATEAGAFYLNTSATADKTYGQLLFNTSERQTANAAQALCDALDSQNIDDMYVKASFFVVSTADKDTFSISEIPTTVKQGETITITGVATEYDGQTVTVEMVSTAFAAVPKETVGSAAFILATTEIAEDGTWEITLDTTGLNIDEYNLAVKIADDLKESVTVNVVEADEPVNPEQPEEPEQPEQPEEPVAPATPGFGALAALAGLGAVAVLLLRRE